MQNQVASASSLLKDLVVFNFIYVFLVRIILPNLHKGRTTFE